MGSFFDAQLDSVFDITFGTFSDSARTVKFTDRDDNETNDLDVIWRDEAVQEREATLGPQQLHVAQIVVKRIQLPEIDPQGYFTDVDGVQWEVDSLGGDAAQGVESLTSRSCVVNLKRREQQSLSPPNRRVD